MAAADSSPSRHVTSFAIGSATPQDARCRPLDLALSVASTLSDDKERLLHLRHGIIHPETLGMAVDEVAAFFVFHPVSQNAQTYWFNALFTGRFSGLIKVEDACSDLAFAVLSRQKNIWLRQLTACAADAESNLEAWVSQFWRYRALELRRREGSRRSRIAELLDLSEHESTLPEPDKREELARAINKAMNCLTEKERTVTELHFLAGLTIAETAEKLGLSEINVKNLVQRNIRPKLRSELKSYE